MVTVLVLGLLAAAGVVVASTALLVRRRVAMRAWHQELEAAFARDEDVPSLQRGVLTPSYAPRHRLAVPEAAEPAETV